VPEEQKNQHRPENVQNPEEKTFDRVVKVIPKTKLKGLRKAILEEVGVQEMCTARIYSVKGATYSFSKPANQDGDAGALEENKDAA